VLIADRQAHASQAALVQIAQELDPERSGLDFADVQADHLPHPRFVHGIGDHQRLAHDAAVVADLDCSGPPIEAELLGTTSLSPTSGGSPIVEPEMQIGTDVPTRSPTTLPPTITQEMTDNPNTIFVNQLGELPDGFSITSTTTLAVDMAMQTLPAAELARPRS
jgi:hypothetical protein